MLERERKIAIRLLITGSGVRVPHNPHLNTSGIKAGYLIIFVSVGNNLLRLLTGFAKVKI